MKRLHWIILSFLAIALVFSLAWASPVQAQTPESPTYTLGVNRDFGYGAGAQIRGLFTVRVAGPADIASVEFLIDGQRMALVNQAPFSFQFNTSGYPSGAHELTAQITTTSGKVYTTPARQFNFITQAQETQSMKTTVFPILGLAFGIVLLSVLLQFVVFRKGKNKQVPLGTERNYGLAGGAICPKCGRPTPRHMMGINLGLGKLDYCENCGKWSVMRAVPLQVLRAAEIAEKANAKAENGFPVKEQSEEEKLREMLEKSKYE